VDAGSVGCSPGGCVTGMGRISRSPSDSNGSMNGSRTSRGFCVTGKRSNRCRITCSADCRCSSVPDLSPLAIAKEVRAGAAGAGAKAGSKYDGDGDAGDRPTAKGAPNAAARAADRRPIGIESGRCSAPVSSALAARASARSAKKDRSDPVAAGGRA